MNIQQFLEHHGVRCNPFAEEDAQTDPVFKEHCIARTYHPAWDKVFGNPAEPSTSIVFGPRDTNESWMWNAFSKRGMSSTTGRRCDRRPAWRAGRR